MGSLCQLRQCRGEQLKGTQRARRAQSTVELGGPTTPGWQGGSRSCRFMRGERESWAVPQIFFFCFALLRHRVPLVTKRISAYQRTTSCSHALPNSDTRAQVVVAYQGHQVFVCAQCATVIVRGAVIRADARTESTCDCTGSPG